MLQASILLISPDATDAETLSGFLDESVCRITAVASYFGALAALGRNIFTTVVCAERLRDGDWKDVLGQTAVLVEPPRFVVLASAANEALFAQAIDYGAYDVLVKPLDRMGVERAAGLQHLLVPQKADTAFVG